MARSTLRTALQLGYVFFTILVFAVQNALAIDEPAEHGLVVQVDFWVATPRNADLDFAFVDISGLSGGGEVQTLRHDDAADPSTYVGWRLTSSPGTELGVRFWEQDQESDAATPFDPQNVGPILATPDFLLQVVDQARAATRLRVVLLDFGARFSHSLSAATRLDLEVGLRSFRYEESTDVSYRLQFGQTIEEFIGNDVDARGFGPRIGTSFVRHLGGRVQVGAGLALALPVGKLQSRTLDELLTDGALQNAARVSRGGARRAFLQLDGELRVDVRLSGRWSVGAGYLFRHWAGVRSSLRFVDEVSQNTVVPDEDDVVLEGLFVGARCAF